jgi:hypothetical protein
VDAAVVSVAQFEETTIPAYQHAHRRGLRETALGLAKDAQQPFALGVVRREPGNQAAPKE